MQRRQVLLSALGLVLAATTVRADVPKTVTILGQAYSVTSTPRSGTFKNGQTVNLQAVVDPTVDPAMAPKKANLAFAPGATADADRLFVVAAHADTLGITSDGFYMLQGADANGVFSPQVSNATVFFRGDKNVHGRPQNVTFLNDTDTGSMKDRNLVLYTFTNANSLRWYDLSDLMAGAPHTDQTAFQKLTLFQIILSGTTEPVLPPDPDRSLLPDDPNMSTGNYQPGALTPNGMMIVAGQEGGDWTLGVIDPLKGTQFFPVKTSLAMTAAANQIDTSELPHAFVHLTGDEYLMIGTGGDPNWNESVLTTNTLYHVRITLPADLTKDAADSIKVDLLNKEDLVALGLGQSDSKMIFGLTVGREVAAGKPVLYMADWAGDLFTLRPQ
jgi:hypothetical protein